MTGQTDLYGVIGSPIRHSLSPTIHQVWIKDSDLNATYVPFLVDNIHAFCEWAKSSNVAGFNVTLPHKEAILPYCDVLSDEVKAIGAANTIVNQEGQWHAYNTDAFGFYESVSTELAWDAAGQTALVLGAGGSAKAVVYALVKAGVKKVILCNRTVAKAEALLEPYQAHCDVSVARLDQIAQVIQSDPEISLLVNTSSLGLQNEVICEDLSALKASLRVYDLIYNPITPLLKTCAEMNIRACGGLGMLVYQAAAAFEYFTGLSPAIENVYQSGRLLCDG